MQLKKLLTHSAFRLALGYMALFGSSSVLLMAFIYWSTAGYMLRQADETIDSEIQLLAERYRQRGLSGLSTLIGERVGQEPPGPSIYLLTDSEFRPLVGNLSRWPPLPPDDEGWLNFDLGMDQHWARARPFLLRGGYHLLVGRDMHELVTLRSQVLSAMGWGLALTAALALLGGLVVSRGRLQRIRVINESIDKVMTGDLSRRIPGEAKQDDIEQLVHHVNGMLEELERLVDGVRRVSDSIAHDLRTPLTRLRQRLELLRQEGGEERAESVEQAIAEADGLLATFGALLRIARIESGQRRAAFGDVDLSALVEDVAELYGPSVEDAGSELTLSSQSSVCVEGDRDLLFQALANLVDNSLKYTPVGGRIQLGLDSIDGVAVLTVADDGPGVPSEERVNVLKRFYRLDASRSSRGAGLGLSLVAAVAELHQAELRLLDNHPGLRVELRIKQK